MRETCLLLVAPPNTDSCSVFEEGKIDTDGKEEEIPKEDESLAPLVLWQDPSLNDRPCPVEGKQSSPDDPSEDQTCATLMVAQITEGCPVSDVGDSENNGVDEDKREA